MELFIEEEVLRNKLLQLEEDEDKLDDLIVNLSSTLQIPSSDIGLFVRRWSRYENLKKMQAPYFMIEQGKRLIDKCVEEWPQLQEVETPEENISCLLGQAIDIDLAITEERDKYIGHHLCCGRNCNNNAKITLDHYRLLTKDWDSMSNIISLLICEKCVENEAIDIL